MNNNTKQRLYFFLVTVVTILVIGKFVYESLKKNSVYFFSPTDLKNIIEIPNGLIRVGGMIKEKSLKKNGNKYSFIVTDFRNEIIVNYTGIKPNLFVEGQGAVIEGILNTRNNLLASKILAKHDENYMPKEVADALKKSGDWKKNYGK
ncbi:MAG: cytochrome c biogenesis protein CcmE [Candidatus Pelagibacter sp.]|nr:cytochrome c biogenesis protein CcmE [Candidatus Pelagibacter sp.]OUV87168.1 MAG: cytochrome c biogenesis protein CcmE [Pelagibacteraceae bacterium TMED136]|tara:strand:+ start:157 stop:600 length:444 start_codon:yes stop_codon:yes gene_type:complete